MMVHLRVARSDSREELPLHFEGVPLKSSVKRFGWPAAVLLVALGLVVMVARPGFAFEVCGALVAATGAIVVTGLVRCRRYELVVGEKWFLASAGPMKRHIPVQLIAGVSERPATSWRRLYADREVVVSMPVGEQNEAFPSREVAELFRALGGVGITSDTS
jgi:hypothetical protein